MEKYAGQDVSFQLAHHVLGNRREERCGDLCRILRQYTNIRDAHTSTEVKLVDPLLPSHGDRPNIFIFVIDSLRPDYLGAYNPRVDFTPNLDAFARDSVALRNVYTQYAGTTLSEPAIWAGAMLLHAHYLQPFPKVNSLEKLARVDDYQMVVSYDTVLSQLLSPSDDMVKLDTDKALWNRFEVCSTVQQTESALDARSDKTRPVLFYAQPMNVHQFAHNDMPRLTEQNWRIRPGFNNRIAYEVHQVDECMGNFFAYLKARKLYDNSIIVLTSDHGDATGEFGRFSHSLSLYPEVLHVPLIVHLPESMRGKFVHDDSRIAALTDIAPTLYYLLGHRPIRRDPMFGQPLFAETREELDSYQRDELFVASDVRAVYGILADRGRFLYTTYDSPAQSLLFDLASDPHAERNIATDALKQQYDERIIEHLQAIAGFYGYKPSVGSLLAAATH
jgi:arylsulfatase A-like enzyme